MENPILSRIMLSLNKYFIIPRFNQQLDIKKLRDTKLHQESELISRFYDGENKICLLFVKTKECTDSNTVREHIEPISTVLSKNYIIAKELEFNSLILHFYNLPPSLKEESKLNTLLSAFDNVKFLEYYSELNYVTIEFSNLQLANTAATFIASIPFAGQKKNICVSDNPFDMPFVSMKLKNYCSDFYSKLDSFCSQFDIKFLNSAIDTKKNRINIQAIGKKTAKKIIKSFNFAKYRNDIIFVNWYIPNSYYLNKIKYFQIKVPLKYMIGDENALMQFYQDYERYGPIYKIKKTNEFYGEVQYQNLETAQNLLQGDHSIELSKARAFTVYNFPPDITRDELVEYFLSGKIRLLYLKGPITKADIWPYCEIIIIMEDSVKLRKHLSEKTCKLTYPFCLPTYQNNNIQSVFQSFRSNNSVELDYCQTSSHVDIYNKYSRFGLFVMFQIDSVTNKMYITFDKNESTNQLNEFYNVKPVFTYKSLGNNKKLDISFPKKKPISIVTKSRPAEVQTYMSSVFLQNS